MGAHLELQTIKALLDAGIGTGLRLGLRGDLFVTPKGRTLWAFLYEWYHDRERYGTTPTLEIIQSRFPGTTLPEKPDYPLPTLVTLLLESRLQRILVARLPIIQKLAEINPIQAVQELNNLREDVSVSDVAGTSMDFAESAYDHISREMEILSQKKGVLGIPFPWDPLTESSGGAQPGETMLVMAPPKVGKTIICLYICAHAFMYHNARVLVFCGKEVSKDDVLRILACMVSNVSLEKYLKGALTSEERSRMLTLLSKIQKEASVSGLHSRLRIEEDLSSDLTRFEEALQEYQPDIAYYDALYAVSDDLRWDKQGTLVSQFCSIAPRVKAFLLASWQAHIREAKTATIEDQSDYAYTQHIMAKPWIVMKLRRHPKSKFMDIGFPASRRLPIDKFKIHFDPGVSMDLVPKGMEIDDPDQDEEPLWE